ncbi:Unknown protein sequence [Pseudomonas congelans]|uniref:Uncharacterized protein n=1 Tax=Pseudomonas congelans TaxID=200452 RepID=A0A0P9RT07_9PSED|nr:Unknown protein sequence [Pseudomonas congelans]
MQLFSETLPELLGRQKASIRAKVVSAGRTLRTGDMPGHRIQRLYVASKARFGTGVDQGHFRASQTTLQATAAEHHGHIRLTAEMTGFTIRRVKAQRQPRSVPGLQAAIEQVDAFALAHPGQQPPGPRGIHSRTIVVQHHIAVRVDAPRLKALQQGGGIGQWMTSGPALDHRPAEVALQIGKRRALDMPLGVTALTVVGILERVTAIENHQAWSFLAFSQLLGVDQLRNGHDTLLWQRTAKLAARRSRNSHQNLGQRCMKRFAQCIERFASLRRDKNRFEHKYLIDATSNSRLVDLRGVFPIGAQKTHPRRQDDPGVETGPFDLRLIHLQDARLDEPPVDGHRLHQTAVRKTPITPRQFLIRRQQVLKVTVQKTVAPHGVDNRQEVIALVLDGGYTVGWQGQETADQHLILGEQLSDDRLLIGEVVIKIAGRDFHVRSDVIGGHATLALLIEQFQTGLHDSFTGFGTRCHAGPGHSLLIR